MSLKNITIDWFGFIFWIVAIIFMLTDLVSWPVFVLFVLNSIEITSQYH